MTTLISATVVVLAAFALGAQWLGTMLIGVPLGVWIVGGAVGMMHAARRSVERRERPTDAAKSTVGDIAVAGIDAEAKAVAGDRSGSWSAGSLSATAMELAGVPARQVRRVQARLDRLSDRLRKAQPTLRVGLDMGEQSRRSLLERMGERGTQVGGVPIEWVHAEAGLISNGAADAQAYDVLIREGTVDGERVLAMFCGGAESAWAEDEFERLTYANLFPTRVRLGRATFSVTRGDERASCLVGAIAIVAAVAERVTVRFDPSVARGRCTLPDGPMVLAAAMNGLADALIEGPGNADGPASPAWVAAQLLGQYATTVGVDLPAGCCVDLARVAAETCKDDPASTLRLGAAQLTSGAHDEGVKTLVSGFRQMRGKGGKVLRPVGHADALAFVMSEAELGARDATTFGRLCAGICLAWATTRSESLDYLQDDLIDDLKHAGWLVGREGEVDRLRTVISALEREVLGGKRGRKVKKAA